MTDEKPASESHETPDEEIARLEANKPVWVPHPKDKTGTRHESGQARSVFDARMLAWQKARDRAQARKDAES